MRSPALISLYPSMLTTLPSYRRATTAVSPLRSSALSLPYVLPFFSSSNRFLTLFLLAECLRRPRMDGVDAVAWYHTAGSTGLDTMRNVEILTHRLEEKKTTAKSLRRPHLVAVLLPFRFPACTPPLLDNASPDLEQNPLRFIGRSSPPPSPTDSASPHFSLSLPCMLSRFLLLRNSYSNTLRTSTLRTMVTLARVNLGPLELKNGEMYVLPSLSLSL